MEKIGKVLTIVDRLLDTNKRRHIVGGTLISVSLLFGGLAITVLSLGVDLSSAENSDSEYEIVYSERRY